MIRKGIFEIGSQDLDFRCEFCLIKSEMGMIAFFRFYILHFTIVRRQKRVYWKKK